MTEHLVRLLADVPGLRLAVLFGSAARPSRPAPRDLDLAVLFSPGVAPPEALAVDLERALGRPVDLIWLDTAPPLLRLEIARDGVPLVESQPYAWADFRVRAMLDWWDWLPTARAVQRAHADRLQDEARRGSS